MKSKCPKCNGTKINKMHFNPGGWRAIKCRWCNGQGEVDNLVIERINEGEKLRANRRSRNISIEEEAEQLNISVDQLLSKEAGLPENQSIFDIEGLI